MSQTSKLILFLSLLHLSLSEPDEATIHPSLSSHPATIPAFPEQSAVTAACPPSLLPTTTTLFKTLPSSCSSPLHRSRCCPSLAAALYSAYAPTALSLSSVSSYNLPVPPDDSETCVANLEKRLLRRDTHCSCSSETRCAGACLTATVMEEKGVRLARPNETCDLVYCYCGIRLHPLRCPDHDGGDDEREMTVLERECRGGAGVGACNKCLHALYELKENKYGKTNKTEDRVKKMQNKDCELMGLTRLLSKNRTTYIHTVTSVLRALMMNRDGHDRPRSCSVDSDGLPLAVDSSEFNDQSSSTTIHFRILLVVTSISMLYLTT